MPEFVHRAHGLQTVVGIEYFVFHIFLHPYNVAVCSLSLVSLPEHDCSGLRPCFNELAKYFQTFEGSGGGEEGVCGREKGGVGGGGGGAKRDSEA